MQFSSSNFDPGSKRLNHIYEQLSKRAVLSPECQFVVVFVPSWIGINDVAVNELSRKVISIFPEVLNTGYPIEVTLLHDTDLDAYDLTVAGRAISSKTVLEVAYDAIIDSLGLATFITLKNEYGKYRIFKMDIGLFRYKNTK